MTREDKKLEITSINTESLSRMFLAGAKNLEAKKEWINELNVFPVPDRSEERRVGKECRSRWSPYH